MKNRAGKNLPQVAFNNVEVDFGSFLDGLLGPMLQAVQQVTEPLAGIIKELNTAIPGLSDLSHAVGQGDVTLLGMIKALGTVDPGFAQYASLISEIVDVVNSINGIQFGTSQVWIPLGSFNLFTNGDLRDLSPAGSPLAGAAMTRSLPGP